MNNYSLGLLSAAFFATHLSTNSSSFFKLAEISSSGFENFKNNLPFGAERSGAASSAILRPCVFSYFSVTEDVLQARRMQPTMFRSLFTLQDNDGCATITFREIKDVFERFASIHKQYVLL